jgi:membrane associated rhomboid family serine protease
LEGNFIGASGLIYVLVSFIFFKGLLTKYYRLVALSLTVIILYGGMLWYIFPKVDDSISWRAFSWIDYRSGSFIYKNARV